MSPFHDHGGYGRRVCLRAFGLLMLIGMTACGAADQQSEANPANPAIPQRASALPERDSPTVAQPPTAPPVVRPRPTAAPVLPKPIKPTSAAAIPAATASRADGWQIYRSAQAGWSIAYPQRVQPAEQASPSSCRRARRRPFDHLKSRISSARELWSGG